MQENNGLLSVDNGEDKIIEADASLIAKEYYTDYARYVLEYRALPSIYDGLKPVQRRIIYTANQQPKKLMKTAKLAGLVMSYHPHGSCLSGDTVFFSLDGKPKTIKEMYDSEDSEFYGLAINSENKIEPCKITHVRVGQVTRKLYHIHLSDGGTITCTGNHPFMNTQHKFIKAEDLKIGYELYSGYWNNYSTIKTCEDKGKAQLIHRLVAEKYLKWSPLSGLHIHHKDSNHYNNLPNNLILYTNSDHRKKHYELTPEIYIRGLKLGRQEMFSSEGSLREEIKEKNSQLIRIYNSTQGLRRAVRAVTILKERGLEVTEENYESLRGEIYNLPFIGRLIKRGYINKFEDLAIINLETISQIYRNNKKNEEKTSSDNLKKRTFIRYYDGKVVKRPLIITGIDIEDLDEDYITYDFTSDVNSNALIITSNHTDKHYSKFAVAHNSSIEGTIYNMAHPLNRLPLFTTKGNFGGVNSPGAASRYTELYLSEISRMNFCSFIDYAKYEVGEIGEMEPKALPTLIPYALIEGSEGIAIGLRTKVMPLNLLDLIDYYIDYIKKDGKSNKTIKPDIGYSLVENEEKLMNIINPCKNKITTSSIVTQIADNTLLIEGLYNKSVDNIINKIDKWSKGLFSKGVIGFRDSSTTSMKYVFEIYDSKQITVDQLKDMIIDATRANTSFIRIMEEEGSAVYSTLDYIVEKSLNCLNEAIDRKIQYELNKNYKQLSLYQVLNKCKESKVFTDIVKMTTDELVHKIVITTDCDEDLAKEVVKKPISYLTKSHDYEEQELLNIINELENHDRKSYLIQLYKDFRKLVKPIYDEKKHSISKNDIINNPCIFINNEGCAYVTDGKGEEFDNIVFFLSDKGYIYKRSVGSISMAEFLVNTDHNDRIIGVVTDKNKYLLLTSKFNDDDKWIGKLVIDLSTISYDKKVVNLRNDESISQVLGINKLSFDNSTYLKHRLSKTIMIKSEVNNDNRI